ncbi:MAG: WecB/TagA/CpsF family glycosyltransferase [Porticoccaceae bacterium]
MPSSHDTFNRCESCEPDVDPVILMGMRVNLTTIESALQSLIQAFSVSHNNAPSTTVTFLNAHYINAAWHDPDYQNAVSAFRWVFPDGVGLRIAARLRGIYPVANIPGTDLVPALLQHSKLEGARVFLLGHEPNAIERVARNFNRRFPAMVLAGYQHGFFDPDVDPAVINAINESGADILLVGMGASKQEKWLMRHSKSLRPRLQVAVGGLFQYWDGSLIRAPRMIQRMRLEWIWILFQHPYKWRRYFPGSLLFLLRALRLGLVAKQLHNEL